MRITSVRSQAAHLRFGAGKPVDPGNAKLQSGIVGVAPGFLEESETLINGLVHGSIKHGHPLMFTRGTVIPWNNGMMEDWNNDIRTKRTFRPRETMQSDIGAMHDAENVTVKFALVSKIPVFQHSASLWDASALEIGYRSRCVCHAMCGGANWTDRHLV